MNGKKGFTFIELMIVMAMLALLISIALPKYFSGLTKAKETILQKDLLTIREAIDSYYSDKGAYPYALGALVDEKYLRKIPVDPITERSDTWIVIPSNDGNYGVYDVISGADGLANDGTQYSSW
jgi:general secretion pathway protein G